MLLKGLKKYFFFMLFFHLFINFAIAEDLTVDKLPFTYNETYIPWFYSEQIFTYRGETIDVADTEYIVTNAPNNRFFVNFHIAGEIIQPIKEFYIDDVKSNFNDYFRIEQNKNIFAIKQIEFQKGFHTIKLKYTTKSNNFTFWNIEGVNFYKTRNRILFSKGGSDKGSYIFQRITYRIPASMPNNLRIDVIESTLENQNGSIDVDNPKIYITDKYVDISYEFLSNDSKLKEKPNSISITPDVPFTFSTVFSLNYDIVRVDRLLQAVIGAILLTLVFYGGIRWQRQIGEKKIQKKPPN